MEETQVSLIDLVNMNKYNNEDIDNYLNRFRQMKLRRVTQIPEHELVE